MKPIDKFKPYIIAATIFIYCLVAAKYFGWFLWAPEEISQNLAISAYGEFKPVERNFDLPSDIEDPFKINSKTPSPIKKKINNSQTLQTIMRKTINRNEIEDDSIPKDTLVYTGYLAKMPGTHQKALISVNSKSYIAAIGDTVGNYKIEILSQDSLLLLNYTTGNFETIKQSEVFIIN